MKFTREEIMKAIEDSEWQKFRLSLKGTDTRTKVAALKLYLHRLNGVPDKEYEQCEIRVQNYLNALARGGFIEPTNKQHTVSLQLQEVAILK